MRTYLRGLYPDFFERENMMAREEKLHLIHEIGIQTGFNPVTGRKYRGLQPDKPWYPKSGAARTAKGRAAQEKKVGFGRRRSANSLGATRAPGRPRPTCRCAAMCPG